MTTISKPSAWASDKHAFYSEEDPYCIICNSRVYVYTAGVNDSTTNLFIEKLKCRTCNKQYRLVSRNDENGVVFTTSTGVFWE